MNKEKHLVGEESLQIRRFQQIPSTQHFSSHIESTNVPAVFEGCTKDWKAFSKWNPSNGGLDYLQEQVGSSIVEAMLSRSAPVFYGDLRNHERVPLPFSTFITSCKRCLQNVSTVHGACIEPEGFSTVAADTDEGCLTSGEALNQVYLAQVPILNIENKEGSPLKTLQEDIQMPTFLETKKLVSINLWMNSARSRSSNHYDPHHNLLCIVAGCKQVVLWPPSASSFLYPMPIYGEASNHSAVGIESLDLSIHPRAKCSIDHSQKIILHAGDALFIPEGWFHQVDSDDLTIAVNFWWQSNMMSSMLQHMDSYYLRRILRRLVDEEMNRMLHCTSVVNGKAGEHMHEHNTNGGVAQYGRDFDDQICSKDLKGNNQKHEKMLNQLEPLEVQALHELVSLVHDTINVSSESPPVDSNIMKDSSVNLKFEYKQFATANSFRLEDDPVASILWPLKPLMLQNVLLAMVHYFPRTLEALILHKLSPAVAEVLTRKFEEMDLQTTKEEQSDFYLLFYGIFDDQFAAMDAILNGKEAFAFQALRIVLDQYLGVNVDRPK